MKILKKSVNWLINEYITTEFVEHPRPGLLMTHILSIIIASGKGHGSVAEVKGKGKAHLICLTSLRAHPSSYRHHLAQ